MSRVPTNALGGGFIPLEPAPIVEKTADEMRIAELRKKKVQSLTNSERAELGYKLKLGRPRRREVSPVVERKGYQTLENLDRQRVVLKSTHEMKIELKVQLEGIFEKWNRIFAEDRRILSNPNLSEFRKV